MDAISFIGFEISSPKRIVICSSDLFDYLFALRLLEHIGSIDGSLYLQYHSFHPYDF